MCVVLILKQNIMKELKHSAVKLLVVHCVACKPSRPFSVENLIACGEAKYGQCSYHYYVRTNGDIIPLLPESVQGVHARHFNYCCTNFHCGEKAKALRLPL